MIKIPNVIIEQYEPVEEVDGRENVIRLLKRENGRYYILKVYDAGSLEVLLSLKKLSPRGVPTIREIYREAFGSAALQNSEFSDIATTQNVEPSATNASKPSTSLRMKSAERALTVLSSKIRIPSVPNGFIGSLTEQRLFWNGFTGQARPSFTGISSRRTS